jgi:hypothetical protein
MPGDSSSFMIMHFLSGLEHAMPEEQRAALTPYSERAAHAGADKTSEWHRAYRCAKWAEKIVSVPENNHLVGEAHRALEAVKEIEQSIGAELGNMIELPFGWSVSPEFELEVAWVYEAVHVAENVAAKVGWENVPWQELVEDLLRI